MINSINGINLNNICLNSVNRVNNRADASLNFNGAAVLPSSNSLIAYKVNPTNLGRITLLGNEQKVYSKVASALPRGQRGQLESLLKRGILLNSKSNDNSTVLDNLYKVLTEKRAAGLDSKIVLSELVNTLNNPFVITQKFGDIPNKELKDIINNPNMYQIQSGTSVNYDSKIKNVRSSACVAASIEFDLASKQPAEFARIANGLTSENICVEKNLKASDIAQNWVEASWFLKEFKSEYKRNGWDGITINMRPDRNAIVRARIQMTHKDPNERSLIDVLMQSTFMNIGSQQTYNSLNDIRTGKYNPDNTGLTDIEKGFAEAVSTGKNKCSVTYQKIDDNGMITGYECDLQTMKKHIVRALNLGENVIIGYTQQDETNKVINGHEITIVSLEKDKNGREVFVCNDTDDESDLPVKYYVDDLLPAIHHAGLPKQVLKDDVDFTKPSWHEVMDYYKSLNNVA